MAEQVVEPGVGWSYQVGFGDKKPKSLVAQMHIPLSMQRDQIDQLLDKIRLSMDRQIAHYELEDAIEMLRDHVARVRELHTAAALAEETARVVWEAQGRNGEWNADRMTPAQQKQQLGTMQNIEIWETKTRECQERVEVLRQKVNGHATVVSADRDPRMPEG